MQSGKCNLKLEYNVNDIYYKPRTTILKNNKRRGIINTGEENSYTISKFFQR